MVAGRPGHNVGCVTLEECSSQLSVATQSGQNLAELVSSNPTFSSGSAGSVRLSPFFLSHFPKPKCFRTSDFKTRRSIRCFANSCHSAPLRHSPASATFALLRRSVCMSGTPKDDGHAWAAGYCSCHFPPLCFTAAEENRTIYSEEL